MFADNSVKLLEPNALYLEECPLKIYKNKKEPRRREQIKKMASGTNLTTRSRTKAKNSKKSWIPNVAFKSELESLTADFDDRNKEADNLGEDPLLTLDNEIKMELDSECHIPKVDLKYTPDSSADNENEEYEPTKTEPESDYELELEIEKEDDDDDDDNYCDDEPLIMLTRSRPRKYSSKKKKTPRIEKGLHVCKHQCIEKFTLLQRESMCARFWSLSKDDRTQYIRNHIKTRVIRTKRKRLTNRGYTNCYYLDDGGNIESPNLIRVCYKYFADTLCLTDYKIKNALEGYQPEIEIEVKPLFDQLKEKKSDEPPPDTEVQQFLNPETGNLETAEPKAKTAKKPSATTPARKRIRRKPGDPLPEHHPKPIKCAQRCIFKCHTKFTEEERKQICDVYWSLEYNRRKDFILARIETRDILSEKSAVFRKTNRPPRAYQTRFFLGSGKNGEHNRVCKHFFTSTLCINRMFITDAINYADKNTGCYTGTFRKGKVVSVNKLAPERKKLILDHIASYPTWVPKSKGKNRYLYHTLTIKRMHEEYQEMCFAKQEKPVSRCIYYRLFHKEFSLYFLRSPDPERGRGFLSLNPTLSPYTGNEPGGMWLDPQGRELDLELHNPADSFMCYLPRPGYSKHSETAASSSSNSLKTQMSSFGCQQLITPNHLHPPAPPIDPALSSTLSCQTSVVRQDNSTNLYSPNEPLSDIGSTNVMLRRV